MIIVTGGAGFIGSAIIAALNQNGHTDIIVVDELGTDSKWKNLRNLAFADYVEKDDFLELLYDSQIQPEVDTIFHMGACSDTTETDASYLIKNNFEYSKILAQWALDNDVRFIYASSAATYGDGEQGFDDDQDQLETLQPLNMYGYSKQVFDLWSKQLGLWDRIVGLKYFNVYGPNEYHKGPMRSFVMKAFEQIRENGKVRLFKSHRPDYEDGEQLRDFIYIKDAVDMTLFFMNHPDVNGLFNIGTGKARSWNDLVHAVFAALDREPNIEYIDMPESIRNQYQYFTQANMDKLRSAGYDQSVSDLRDAVQDYVQHYLIKEAYLP